MMKRISIITAGIITCIIACIIASCNSIGTATIKGKTLYDERYSLHLSYMDNNEEQSLLIPVNKDGSFSKEIELKKATILTWQFETKRWGVSVPPGGFFYVEKGEVIDFDFIIKKWTKENPRNFSCRMKGELSEANKMLDDFYRSNFITKRYREEVKYKTIDELLDKHKGVNKEVKDLMHFQFIFNEIEYRTPSQEKIEEVLKVLNTDVINKVGALDMYAHKFGYSLYIDYKTSASSMNTLSETLKSIKKDIANKRLVGKMSKMVLKFFLENYALKQDFNSELKELANVVSVVEDKKIRDDFLKEFKYTAYSVNGAPMPDVSFVDRDGKKVNIKDFKGKYTYIDLWYVG